MNSRHTLLRRLVPVALAIVLLAGVNIAFATAPPEPERIAFGQVGIAFGQSVELSVVNIGSSQPPEPEAPPMELLILDQGGNILARSIETVAAGHSATLKFNSDLFRRAVNRMHLRALVRFVAPPEPDAPAPRIVTNFEVFDNFTGRTSLAICPCGRPGTDSQLRAP